MSDKVRGSRSKVPARAWQRMLSGRRLDILMPSPLDIEIDDIAHGLARVARWNGQTKGAFGFSVAQHSVLVEDILSRNAPRLQQKWRLACLLHDAPEYVIGDMITPVKSNLGKSYKEIEASLMEASTKYLGCYDAPGSAGLHLRAIGLREPSRSRTRRTAAPKATAGVRATFPRRRRDRARRFTELSVRREGHPVRETVRQGEDRAAHGGVEARLCGGEGGHVD